MRTRSLRTSDGHLLAADVAHPRWHTRGAAVVCHPHPLYGGNRFNPVVEALFRALPRAGLTTIRFEFRANHDDGIGERLDVVAAIDAVAAGDAPVFVLGYSFGALVALATNDERIAGIVAVAPPLTPQVTAPTAPTLVLSARHDQFCPADTATAIVAAWPGAEFDVVESADHFLAGHAAAVAERSVAWLAGRLPP